MKILIIGKSIILGFTKRVYKHLLTDNKVYICWLHRYMHLKFVLSKKRDDYNGIYDIFIITKEKIKLHTQQQKNHLI